MTKPLKQKQFNFFVSSVGKHLPSPSCSHPSRFFAGDLGIDIIEICVPKVKEKPKAELLTPVQLKEQEKLRQLLKHLKHELIAAGKEINPYGSLARSIEKIQASGRLRIIDMNKLNSKIKSNALKQLAK